jgi:hypothetical protein
VNDELQKALAEFVRTTLATFQQGKDFVLAQAPEVIQQLIRWHFWNEIAVGTGCLLGFIVLVSLTVWMLKKWGEDSIPGLIFTVFAAVMCGIQCCGSYQIALQIYLAPKVWLIEWAMAQVKK